MGHSKPWSVQALQEHATAVLTGPTALVLIPAFSLLAFWIGGESALIVVSVAIPLGFLFSYYLGPKQRDETGLLPRGRFEDLTEDTLRSLPRTNRHSATFFVALENYEQLNERYGQASADLIVLRTGERLLAGLRADDHLAQMGDARFAICLAPVRNLDLENCIQSAGRLLSGIEEPIMLDGVAIYISANIGFCQNSQAPNKSGTDWIQAAATALREAERIGPSAIRAFSEQMRRETLNRAALLEEVGPALESGHIQPWFQPQISTDTGEITGFEALARWSHPMRGMIPPSEFLPAIEKTGLLERLAEVMMYHAFTALKAWDGAGVTIPQVGVNFAGAELSNPQLTEKIKWELDRFDLTPDRLAVEVLETVIASNKDDTITRNISALGELGCRIDLDDFGTGHASISSIRQFAVSRIKIDRSFVMKADRDPEQQRMISAILTMAERLGMETLAEGVESVGEHVLLAQLGCDHVQGFGIAQPMPFEQTLDWIFRHNAKLTAIPRIMDGRI